MSDLDQLRGQIDQLDEQIIGLLNRRAQIVEEIGHIKQTQQGSPPIYSPDRERQVFDRIKALNSGPLPDRCLLAVYRELMSGSFFLERPLRIAFLGPEGSFSHTAAMLKFGQSVEYEPLPDITSVFDEITRQHCDLGIIPVENSIAGGVIETLDSFMDTTVSICGEVLMEIHHNLLANCSLSNIKQVFSRPEVFSQCRRWLSATLPKVDLFPTGSSAAAAQKSSQEPGSAAIGSRLAAELYGLNIVCENIEDVTNNVTRFLVIGRESARPTGRDKTALVFATAHKAGALVDVLQAFRYNGVNLTNIESRPSRKRQREYCFFVDCQGHQDDTNVRQALDEARRHCLQLSVLGSFPQAVEVL